MIEATLACIVGARPNFMKMAPILRALESYPMLRPVLIHTGQHYDAALSDVFFEELEMPRPDLFLGAGSGKHGAQTARVLHACEDVFEQGFEGAPFAAVIVVGDVNSTMAATLAAAKLGIPVAHVEAGLRSFDRSMPEEINRVVTDAVADWLLVSEPAGVENLRREGHAEEKLFLVGNTMIDTLDRLLPSATARNVPGRFDLRPQGYAVLTLHRPANVDAAANLERIVQRIVELSETLPIAFPVHPRTRKRLEEYDLARALDTAANVLQLPPLGYLDFVGLTAQAKLVVTDSGGLQDETTALGVPCLTMRPNTERPITVEEGTSTLVADDFDLLRSAFRAIVAGAYKCGKRPSLWDGRAAERIARVLAAKLELRAATVGAAAAGIGEPPPLVLNRRSRAACT